MRTLLVILLLAMPVLAQQSSPQLPTPQLSTQPSPQLSTQPSPRLSTQPPPRLSTESSSHPRLWNWSDAALGGAMFADEVSTVHALSSCATCREWGIVNPGLRIGLKAGVFGFFKVWEYKKPEDRRKIRWIKLAFSGLFVGVSIHNMMPKK